MEILYEPVVNDERHREVYVNGKYYTKLHCNQDGTIFTYSQHPLVDLAKLFKDAAGDKIGFYSALDLKVSLRFKGE